MDRKIHMRYSTAHKNSWIQTPSLAWKLAHRAGTDPTFNPISPIDRMPLDPPHGPTTERLTIQSLDGLSALDAKYAKELEAGRALQNRLDD
jgi:hypothetical protein